MNVCILEQPSAMALFHISIDDFQPRRSGGGGGDAFPKVDGGNNRRPREWRFLSRHAILIARVLVSIPIQSQLRRHIIPYARTPRERSANVGSAYGKQYKH